MTSSCLSCHGVNGGVDEMTLLMSISSTSEVAQNVVYQQLYTRTVVEYRVNDLKRQLTVQCPSVNCRRMVV